MKKLAASLAFALIALQSFAFSSCKCTTNWIHVVLYAGGTAGPWAPVSFPHKAADFWVMKRICTCPAGPYPGGMPPKPPMFTSQPSPTNTPPLFGFTPSGEAGTYYILNSLYQDDYAATNGYVPPYFQTISSYGIEESTNMSTWTRTFSVTNWNGSGTMVSTVTCKGVPIATNAVTSDNGVFTAGMELTVDSNQSIKFFRVVSP